MFMFIFMFYVTYSVLLWNGFVRWNKLTPILYNKEVFLINFYDNIHVYFLIKYIKFI